MSDAPAGAFRSRVRDGVAQWDQLNQTFTFGSEQGDVGWWLASLTPCNSWASRNAIGFHNVDGAGLARAVTTRCLNQTGPHTAEMKKFAVEFDSSENWYMGTGDATGTQVDAWSIASHELGHAAGWGPHLPSSESICADNSGQNTMCPTYVTATQRMRTLELHHIHTFQSAH